MTRQLQGVYTSIAIYAMANWMCAPVLPFLMQHLGADPLIFGYLQTCAGLAQMLGGPLLGWCADRKGARTAMIISHCAGGLSYFCMAVAWNVPMLFLAKIPIILQALKLTLLTSLRNFNKILQHALQAAQGCISHVYEEKVLLTFAANHSPVTTLTPLTSSIGPPQDDCAALSVLWFVRQPSSRW